MFNATMGTFAIDSLKLAEAHPPFVISHSLFAVEYLEHTFTLAIVGVGSVLP